jgi:hypothetical protein
VTLGRFLRRYLPAIVIAMTIVLCILFAAIYDSGVENYLHVLREDGPVEWTTAIMAWLAGLLGLYHALRTWRTTRTINWFAIVFGFGCLFIGFEEISWGQRLFDIQTPTGIARYNVKDETNLHNMFPKLAGVRTRYISAVIVFVYGVTLPLLSLAAPVRRSLERYNVIFPDLSLVLLFFIAGLLAFFDQPTGEEEELAEMLITIGYFLTIALYLIRIGDRSAGFADVEDRRSLFAAPLIRVGTLLATLALAVASVIVLLTHYSDAPTILGRYSLTYFAYVLYSLTVIAWWAGLALLALFRWQGLQRIIYRTLAARRGRLFLAAIVVILLYAVSLVAASLAPATVPMPVRLAPAVFISGAVLVIIPILERLFIAHPRPSSRTPLEEKSSSPI